MVSRFKLVIRMFEVRLASINRVIRCSLAATLSISCGLAVAQCPFNVTGGAVADALRDGLALTRAAVSITPLSGAPSALLPAQIRSAIAANEVQLDINNNGYFDVVDSTVIARFLFGFRGDALLPGGAGSAGVDAKRTTGAAMQTYTDAGCPATAVKKWSQNFPTTGGVFISVLDHVELDVDVDLDWLEIQGRVFCSDKNINLTSRWIIVHSGKFQCGTPIAPFTKKLVITLTGTNPTESALGAGMGTKVFGVMHGGALQLYGESKRAWTRLATTAAVGATTIELADPPVAWRVGDQIAIAPSDFDALEAERRSITAINGNTLTLNVPLTHAHWGAVPQHYAGHTLDMRAEVGNLTRNIVVRSAQNEVRVLPGFDPERRDAQGRQNGDGARLESGRFGGHMMFMANSIVHLKNIEVTEMGQQGMLGRYPVHWHLNQDTSRGSFIRGSSVHSNFQRGVVIHQSNYVDVDSNVIYDTPGHAVFVEDGIERFNSFTNNLIMKVAYVLRKHRLSLKDPGNEGLDRAERQSGFWITNPQNRLRGNVVAGVENGWGYIFADVRSDKIPVVARTLADFATNTSMLEFRDNVAHSVNFVQGPVDGGGGVFNLGYGPEEAGSCFRFDQRGIISPQSAVVSGVTAYKCRNAAFWSTNFKPVVNSVVADSRSAIVNNQGEPDATELGDSLLVARTDNNPASRTSLDFGPFPGPTLFEALESGPAQLRNTVVVDNFKASDNSTPEVIATTPASERQFDLTVSAAHYLSANASTNVPVSIARAAGFTDAVSARVAIPKAPNLSADNPYFYVTSDPMNIAGGANSGSLVLRNTAHPKSGDGNVLVVASASGGATVATSLQLFTATAPILYVDTPTGNNVARLFANTGSPRNPSLSAMEFNRGGGFAVDGNISSYAHTSGTPLSWWQLDLERVHRVKEVRIKATATEPLSDLWLLTSDFPVLTRALTLDEALAMPAALVKRFEVSGSVGVLRTITLPANSTARVIRLWSKNLGEIKIPEIEVVTQ
jgi:G8 domain